MLEKVFEHLPVSSIRKPGLARSCAAPLLWLAAKVMRWNVTMFCDVTSFIFGASPMVRTRIEATLELERVADALAISPRERR